MIGRSILKSISLLLVTMWLVNHPAAAQKEREKKVEHERAELSVDQQHAYWSLLFLSDELKNESDKPAAAMMQARIADLVWRFDEPRARAIFQLAFDSVRQPAVDESSGASSAEPRTQASLHSQAAALGEIIRRLGRHDRETAETLLKQLERQETIDKEKALDKGRTPDAAASRPPLPNQADMLAHLAIEMVRARPEQAQRLALRALSGNQLPEAFGLMLFTFKTQDEDLSDALYRAAIAAMRRGGYAYTSALIPVSNYKFDWQGRPFGSGSPKDAQLLIDYFVEAAKVLGLSWREARLSGHASLPESSASLVGFLSAYGVPILRQNDPERLGDVVQILAEVSAGLSEQQRQSLSTMLAVEDQSRAISSGLNLDYDTQLHRAEQERDPAVRNILLRSMALDCMRADAARALSISEKINDFDLRAQTEDDINLYSIAGKLQKKSYEDARKTALKLRDFSLRAKVLAELAELALSGDEDTIRANNLLTEAYSIALKGENTNNKLAALLIVTGQFAKSDPLRGFDAMTDIIKTINNLKANRSREAIPGRPTITLITKIHSREMTTDESITIDSIDFNEIRPLFLYDYTRARIMGEAIENKLLRAKFRVAVASTVLNEIGKK